MVSGSNRVEIIHGIQKFMKLVINVFFEGFEPFRFNVSRLRRWVTRVAEHQQQQVRSLNVIMCSDQILWQYNQAYLDHDTYTDIITFYHHDKGEPIEGELFISIDRIKENAETLGITWSKELDRVIIHGVLHLMGHNDATLEEKSAMRTLEDYCLTLRE